MALAQPRPLSLDEVLDRMTAEAKAGRSVAALSAEYMHLLDDREIGEPLAIGIATLVHRRLATQRQGRVDMVSEIEKDAGPTPVAPRPHAARLLWQVLLAEANYEAADGSRKALRDFTHEDAAHLRGLFGARAEGLNRRRDAMDLALAALEKHHVATIGALPARAQQQIAAGLT